MSKKPDFDFEGANFNDITNKQIECYDAEKTNLIQTKELEDETNKFNLNIKLFFYILTSLVVLFLGIKSLFYISGLSGKLILFISFIPSFTTLYKFFCKNQTQKFLFTVICFSICLFLIGLGLYFYKDFSNLLSIIIVLLSLFMFYCIFTIKLKINKYTVCLGEASIVSASAGLFFWYEYNSFVSKGCSIILWLISIYFIYKLYQNIFRK